MRYLITLLLVSVLALAAEEKLIIDANNFETDDSRGLTTFTGNVKLRKLQDKLNSYKLEIYMKPNSKGKSQEPIKYVATGNADFEIHTNGKVYKGKGKKVIYSPKTQEYTILGDGYVEELTEGRKLYGERIFINQLTGNARVSGNQDKPVRFIINLDNGAKEQ